MSARLLPIAAALSLTTGVGCATSRSMGSGLAVDRLAELDTHHGFQDLTFNTRCADLRRGPDRAEGHFGFELAETPRTMTVAPGAEGTLTVGCYEGLLGYASVEIHGQKVVKRAQRSIVDTYGVPTATSVDGTQARWQGERVEVAMTLAEDGRSATVSYRSLLSEALWRRDVYLANRSEPIAEADPEPEVFRLSENGIF